MNFAIINLTTDPVLNHFFTFPIYLMIVSLPFIAIINLIKKI